MQYKIRPLTTHDIPAFLVLTRFIDSETDFLGMAPEDPRPSPIQLASVLKTGRQIIFVAENEHGLIAHLGAFWRRGQGKRLRHCMNVGLGVAKDYWGQGIGNALFEAFEAWASNNGITRLELEVMEHNKAAIALYKKRGFEIEGAKKNSIKVKGEYVNEILMAKILL